MTAEHTYREYFQERYTEIKGNIVHTRTVTTLNNLKLSQLSNAIKYSRVSVSYNFLQRIAREEFTQPYRTYKLTTCRPK